MNIDKDIEILKEFKETGFATLMIKYDKDRIQANTMVKTALENVLKALEGKDCVIETLQHNEEVNEKMIRKLEQELETHKKMTKQMCKDLIFMGTNDKATVEELEESYRKYVARKEVKNG